MPMTDMSCTFSEDPKTQAMKNKERKLIIELHSGNERAT